jgi:hypothetical protein
MAPARSTPKIFTPHAQLLTAKGVAKVDLDVSDQLDVEISGPSSVTYKGNPAVNKNIHGPGKLTRRDGEGA